MPDYLSVGASTVQQGASLPTDHSRISSESKGQASSSALGYDWTQVSTSSANSAEIKDTVSNLEHETGTSEESDPFATSESIGRFSSSDSFDDFGGREALHNKSPEDLDFSDLHIDSLNVEVSTERLSSIDSLDDGFSDIELRSIEDVLTERPVDAKDKNFSAKKMAKLETIQKLNQTGETSISRTIKAGDTPIITQNYTTDIKGASEFSSLKQSYLNDGIKIVASKDDANQSHSVNANLDTLTAEDGTDLYRCVRSGVYTTPKIKDKGERLEAADTRFDENLLIALESKDLLSAENSEEKPIELAIADIGLLSGKIGSGFGKEHIMQDEQFAFLEVANNQPRKISYTDKNNEKKIVWVKPDVIPFNFGVSKYDATIDSLTGGALNEAKNYTSFNALQQHVSAKINSLNEQIGKPSSSPESKTTNSAEIEALALEKKTIEELSNQLHEMFSNGNVYSPVDKDRYGFTSRLNLLCYKVGLTPMIHCKSGKDRTARLIEETKSLAIQIHENKLLALEKEVLNSREALTKTDRLSFENLDSTLLQESDIQTYQHTGPLPSYNISFVPKAGKLSLDQQKLLLSVSMNSGNDVIQKNCTGKPGNKQHDTFKERIPDLLADKNSGAADQFDIYAAQKGTET